MFRTIQLIGTRSVLVFSVWGVGRNGETLSVDMSILWDTDKSILPSMEFENIPNTELNT